MEDKMGELSKFPVNTSMYDNLDNRYGFHSEGMNYNQIYYKQSDLTKSFVYSTKNIPLNVLGKGSIARYSMQLNDSIQKSREIEELANSFSSQALDSVNALKSQNPGLEDNLLQDIRNDRALSYLFNSRPATLRTYANSMSIEQLRRSRQHLIYWGNTAYTEYVQLPKKHGLPSQNAIIFQKQSDGVHIIGNGQDLGTVDGNFIHCNRPELLQMPGCPNTTYVFGKQQYVTDNMGRVVRISQEIGADTKGKVKFRDATKLNSKNFATILGNDQLIQLFNGADIAYSGINARINTFYIEKNDDNKASMKALKKAQNEALKRSGSFTRNCIIHYGNGSQLPSSIEVEIAGERITLINYSVLTSDVKSFIPTKKEEENSFMQELINSNAQEVNEAKAKRASVQAKVKQDEIDMADLGMISLAGGVNVSHGKIVQGHEAVDLGLSVKWAASNLSAGNPGQVGGYYVWGKTTPVKPKTLINMKSVVARYPHDKGMLRSADDVATKAWGSDWRFPTRAEFEELYSRCSFKYVKKGNIQGVKLTGPNGNSIFLPVPVCHCTDYQTCTQQYHIADYDNSQTFSFSTLTHPWAQIEEDQIIINECPIDNSAFVRAVTEK